MPINSESSIAPRNRFGFHQEPLDSDSVRSSPAIFKSSSRDNISQSLTSYGERDDVGATERGGLLSSNQSFELQEDPSFWKDHNVQVIIRVRPLSNPEISIQGYNKCVRQDSSQTITWIGHPESRFTFDVVADESVTQEKLFRVAGLPMVDNCMGGYNSCMFAYGQEKESRRDEKLRFTCKCSFLEIYNEQILDLLDPSSVNLQIREDAKKGVYVENLTELEVTNARDVIQQLVQGAANRKVAATNMNRASSRSHSVFTCVIESKWESQGVTHIRFARLNLVDLAGSERQKSSGAEGERLKEATNINKSLSALGLVIMNLVDVSNGKSLHVPYRDSKLTFLLQDSLGGNSKTTIIANISPSNSCSLETLSTLKFAQRAKFIKNNVCVNHSTIVFVYVLCRLDHMPMYFFAFWGAHMLDNMNDIGSWAVVNEDASGDVLTMRIQIQQLKNEVSRLQGLVKGHANEENDNLEVSFPGSPGIFKWEGLQGSFSPLMCDKRVPRKKQYEAALVGAFRREKDKEIALQALAVENQATMQLAKQREDEIQGLKMRLRFREAGIKRLEAVASGKISAETHLLQEKEEYLKEIEVLRNQVDRNQEVTRFAMENLRLKEELRRLNSFCEEGEREMMNEQIMVLENKLLEALDWKLMHETDPQNRQEGSLGLHSISRSEDTLLISDPASPWSSTINEENEFLRMQAIQNQSEMELLHRKYNLCLEEKEKLGRRIDDLLMELEEEKSSRNMKREVDLQLQVDLLASSRTIDDLSNGAINDQMELKTMVDAIAAASQREAESHETSIILAKENEELRMKLKILIEDNNKLIELYEGAVGEASKIREIQFVDPSETHTNDAVNLHEENVPDKMKVVETLEYQLQEMHEENDKLMGLYEKAMQERDEFKKLVFSNGHNNVEIQDELECPEKLVQVDEGEKRTVEEKIGEVQGNIVSSIQNLERESESSKFTETHASKELKLARMKLDMAHDKLGNAAKTIGLLVLLEKATLDVDMLSRKIETVENCVGGKRQEISELKLSCHDSQDKQIILENKLLALKYSLSSFSSSIVYWQQREAQAKARVDASSTNLELKKEELAHIREKQNEIDVAQQKAYQSETELRRNLVILKSKWEEENQKKKTEEVLFEIDNVDKLDILMQRKLQIGGKATELLRSEEERMKLQAEMKQTREKLGTLQKGIEDMKLMSDKLENKAQAVKGEIVSLEKLESSFRNINQEKEVLLEFVENGKNEVGKIIVEYQQSVFDLILKQGEMEILKEELNMEMRMLEELRETRMLAIRKKSKVLDDARCTFITSEEHNQSQYVSVKAEEELQDVTMSVLEARSLLGVDCQ
ncbi:hypothetical protein GIB67_034304 [Kingdonia uniflora]|uniref:Kinesin motor domain-containing protein n=1 Tax=Kingdonia uniflora TaxID=39325 RepID=A0A7J7NSG1_9MAGN|nr:hypothetical protein GIB67_034304 [Kingdonia uniflora]